MVDFLGHRNVMGISAANKESNGCRWWIIIKRYAYTINSSQLTKLQCNTDISVINQPFSINTQNISTNSSIWLNHSVSAIQLLLFTLTVFTII